MTAEWPRPIRVTGEASAEATGTTNPLVKAIERLNPGQGVFVLDLNDFEVDDGYPCTQCVNAIRELLVRGGKLTLVCTPSILAESLERAGLLLPPTGLRLIGARPAPAQ